MEPENFIPFLTVTSIVEDGIEHSTIDNHGHKSYLDMLFTVEQKRTPILLTQDRQREREDYERAITVKPIERKPLDHRINALPPKEHNKRMKLYKQGLNDREIADKVNRSPSAIRKWRMLSELPANDSRGKNARRDEPNAPDKNI